MFTVPCNKELLDLEGNSILKTGASAGISLMTEPLVGRATCKVTFFDADGAEIPELSIWFTTEVPSAYLLEFRRALTGNSEKLDELHEILLLSPEGRASVPQ
jgi:hypothetical protein